MLLPITEAAACIMDASLRAGPNCTGGGGATGLDWTPNLLRANATDCPLQNAHLDSSSLLARHRL